MVCLQTRNQKRIRTCIPPLPHPHHPHDVTTVSYHQEEFEDNLLLYMEDEFDVVLEDGSEQKTFIKCAFVLQAEEQAKLMVSQNITQ
jgi:hypothetical protein